MKKYSEECSWRWTGKLGSLIADSLILMTILQKLKETLLMRVGYDSAGTFLSSTNEHYLERFLTKSVLEWTLVFLIAWKIHLHVGHVL